MATNKLTMTPVTDSSKIKAIGYDTGKRQLHIEFVGGTYVFDDVPEELYNSMMLAKIKFMFFRENVMGIYQHRKIAEEHQTPQ